MAKLIHGELVYYLQGVGFRIHNTLKGGHEEKDYEKTLAWILQHDNVQFLQQPQYLINYKSQQVGEYYPDILIGKDAVILELKVASQIEPLHIAQTLSYLAVTGADLGLIMNFGSSSMEYKRLPNFLSDRHHKRGTPPEMPSGILYPDLTHTILDSMYEVHRLVGPGFLHQVYRRAVRIEFGIRRLSYEYVKELSLRFENMELNKKKTQLFWVESKVLVAVTALKQITSKHSEKLRWAMKELGCPLGIITTFYPAQLGFQFIRQ